MIMQYKWTKPEAIYPDRNNKSYAAKRLRYRLRSLLHWGAIQKFEQFINSHPQLVPLMNQRQDYGYPLVHRFLDKRFNTQQRFAAICDNLLFLPEKLPALSTPLWDEPLEFGEVVPDFTLRLLMNAHQPMEGYWSFELIHQPTQEVVYLLTFGKLEDALLIAVVQGPNFEGAKEMVKQLTKLCHGLRPAYLMVEVMKMFTQILGYANLLGIPQKYQNKSRIIQCKRYVVNYDAIFAESGGSLEKYWRLPLVSERDWAEIPSKKRSMYRKRDEMLSQIGEKMRSLLGAVDSSNVK